MIFGKTLEQREAEDCRKAKEAIFGIKKFAYKPVKLNDGRSVFLDFYYEYRDGKLRHGKYELHQNIHRYINPSLRHVCLYDLHFSMIDEDKLKELIES